MVKPKAAPYRSGGRHYSIRVCDDCPFSERRERSGLDDTYPTYVLWVCQLQTGWTRPLEWAKRAPPDWCVLRSWGPTMLEVEG